MKHVVTGIRFDRVWTVIVYGAGIGSGATFSAAFVAASRALGGVS